MCVQTFNKFPKGCSNKKRKKRKEKKKNMNYIQEESSMEFLEDLL